LEEDEPWWRVDLENVLLVKSVSLKNNEDPCCINRLSNATVRIRVNLTGFETCGDFFSMTTAGELRKINCRPWRRGRYVEIVNTLRTSLTLCEVEVEAYIPGEGHLVCYDNNNKYCYNPLAVSSIHPSIHLTIQ
jgi:hypothetical protein